MSHWCRFRGTDGQVTSECQRVGAVGSVVESFAVFDQFVEGVGTVGGELPTGAADLEAVSVGKGLRLKARAA